MADIAAFPLFGIVMGLYGLVTMSLDNAYSRWRERLSERYALEMTENGPVFALAMTRLANQNLAEVDPDAVAPTRGWSGCCIHTLPSCPTVTARSGSGWRRNSPGLHLLRNK